MNFVKKEIAELKGNPFTQIGEDWYLITAGTKEHYNTMTASWGFMGVMWGKPTFICAVRTNRYTYSFMEESEVFTLCFFEKAYRPALQFCGTKSGRDHDKAKETGLTPIEIDGVMAFAEASRIFVCKKCYSEMMKEEAFTESAVYDKWYGTDPLHKQFFGEILAVYEKE
ncbi:MAG: flavin reductase [Ruminococcus sp.]|nr:flavin reductase [Ruminococcus sp.]